MSQDMKLIPPPAFTHWLRHRRIRECLPDGFDATEAVRHHVDAALTDLGSTFLHLLFTNAPHPAASIVMETARFLIIDCGADVNRTDKYGRTPLTMLVAEAPGLWSAHPWYAPYGNPANGLELLQLMLDRGGDPDVLYTPRTPAWAQCSKWRLVHECAYGEGRAYMPDEMRQLLSTRWNAMLPDSEGRVAGAGETGDLFAGIYKPTPSLGVRTVLESERERGIFVA